MSEDSGDTGGQQQEPHEELCQPLRPEEAAHESVAWLDSRSTEPKDASSINLSPELVSGSVAVQDASSTAGVESTKPITTGSECTDIYHRA